MFLVLWSCLFAHTSPLVFSSPHLPCVQLIPSLNCDQFFFLLWPKIAPWHVSLFLSYCSSWIRAVPGVQCILHLLLRKLCSLPQPACPTLCFLCALFQQTRPGWSPVCRGFFSSGVGCGAANARCGMFSYSWGYSKICCMRRGLRVERM